MLAPPAPFGAVHDAKVRAVFSSRSTRCHPMALPTAAPNRRPKHRRSIDVQIFARDDGLWEVDARLIDTKTRDLSMADGSVRPSGTPLHEMLLRLVVNAQLDIVAAGAETTWMPYPGHCNAYALPDGSDIYGRLVGLNLLDGFRAEVRRRLGGAQGCTHITEMSQVLPSAVIQALAGEVIDTREGSAEGAPPFQIDRCHALRSGADAVRLYYPKWYRADSAQNPSPIPR